jgi:hypothetical protein
MISPAAAARNLSGKVMTRYRLVLECDGVPSDPGAQGAVDITKGFAKRRWHRNARCNWDGKSLSLTVENDFDPDGRALMDEFSDEISACIRGGFGGDLRIVSVTEISQEA